MSDAEWNETSRQELRNELKSITLGEVRLMNSSHEDIVDFCREVYIKEDSPENEWEDFTRFATTEIGNSIELLKTERKGWPLITDCDHLDRVEEDLRNKGILLWQVSPCCDTCTGAELPDRIDEIEQRYPGFRRRVRGYAFYIDQNMPEMLAESSNISIHLAYGWFAQDDSDVSEKSYEKNALSIAHEVCECLKQHNFNPEWDGDFSKKIGVSLNWQRRKQLI